MAEEMNSPISFASDNYRSEFISLSEAGQKFRIRKNDGVVFEELLVGLLGKYQEKNICTVLQSLEILKKIFSRVTSKNIVDGQKNVSANTGLLGRWQIIGKDPLTIIDVAHNEAGIKYVMEQLEELISESQKTNLHIVFGMVNDKDPSRVLSLLPKNSTYYFCRADMPRAMDAAELKKSATQFNIVGESFPSVKEAFLAAQKNAKGNDVVFVGGSTFVVAEVI